MKYEVINISTTTETYIANDILTHNKGTSPTTKDITIPINLSFGANYSPQYPFSLDFQVTYDNSNAPNKSAAFVNSSPISVANSSQLTQNLTLRIYNWDWSGNMPYTASSRGRDTTGVYSSGSNSFTYSTSGNYYGVSVNCLTPETLITKYDNTNVCLKDVQIGDELLTIDLQDMQYKKSIVTHKQNYFENRLFYINGGTLKSSDSHNHIVKRNDIWVIKKSYELLIGDIILKKSLEEIPIDQIEII